jgi:hypothetical protein
MELFIYTRITTGFRELETIVQGHHEVYAQALSTSNSQAKFAVSRVAVDQAIEQMKRKLLREMLAGCDAISQRVIVMCADGIEDTTAEESRAEQENEQQSG